MASLSVASPVGPLRLVADEAAITALSWDEADDSSPSALLEEAARQLAAYFAGRLRDFALPLAPAGSPSDRRIWRAMATIPYGETWSYGALGRVVALPPRVVGGACGRNPIAILLPCHRVLAADGSLHGYSGRGGLATKQFLLALEQPALL